MENNQISRIKALSSAILDEKRRRVTELFVDIPIFEGLDGYPYSLFSLTDFYPPLQPSIVEDIADLIVYYGNFETVDIIVSEADRGGGPITHAVAVRVGLPYTLANWYRTEVPGQVAVMADVRFSGSGLIYLNGIRPGQRAIFVDDVLSSGGTALALLDAVNLAGGQVTETLFVVEKVDQGGAGKIQSRYSIPITSLVRINASGVKTALYKAD